MASYQIPAPTKMSLQGDVTENWKDFEAPWDNYIVATDLRSKLKLENGLNNPAGQKLVAATLCAIMGAECYKVLQSLNTNNTVNLQDAPDIIQTLRDHFVPKRHKLLERHKLWLRIGAESVAGDEGKITHNLPNDLLK